MANTRFQHKRSTVSGVVPTTSDIATGELGINLADRRIFTSNGSAVFELGANLTSLTTTTNTVTIGTAVSIAANGNVGIGTSSPAYSLDISGTSNTTTGIRISDTNSGQAQLVLTEGSNTGQVSESGGVLFITNFAPAGSLALSQANDRPITMNTNNTERMRIDGSGNIGIGNTAPAHRLRVQGDISLSGGIHANGSVGSDGQVLTSNGTVSYWANTSSGGITTGKAIAMAIVFG